MLHGKILVIDDDPQLRQTLGFALRQEGAQIILAADGLEGFMQARREKPDLIITDDLMPNVDGYDLARELQMDMALMATPVIMMAQLDSAEHRQLAHYAGVKLFITKPIALPLLIDQIDELLAKKVG